MATPMSAFFNAGASFTPCPFMATMAPERFSASTMRSFFLANPVFFLEACLGPRRHQLPVPDLEGANGDERAAMRF
jgi:hypothetical protein